MSKGTGRWLQLVLVAIDHRGWWCNLWVNLFVIDFSFYHLCEIPVHWPNKGGAHKMSMMDIFGSIIFFIINITQMWSMEWPHWYILPCIGCIICDRMNGQPMDLAPQKTVEQMSLHTPGMSLWEQYSIGITMGGMNANAIRANWVLWVLKTMTMLK